MKPALIIINELLQKAGLSGEEADRLMARFLVEEAQEYIEFVNNSKIDNRYTLSKVDMGVKKRTYLQK